MLTPNLVNATSNQDTSYKYLGYGFEDQRQALKFLQSNITNFGGDPAKVWIFNNKKKYVSLKKNYDPYKQLWVLVEYSC